MDGRLGLHYFTLWTFTTGTSSYQCHTGLGPQRRLRHRWLPPYGTSSRSYSQTRDLGNTTTTTVSNLLPGQTYYFAVSDYSAAAVESHTGQSDLVWESARGAHVIWILNDGVFQYAISLPNVGGGWHVVGAGDFNGGGQADLVWENATTGLRVIWIMKDGGFVSSISLGTINPSWHIAAVGDFLGNGQSDLVWENTTTGQRAIWLMKNGVHSSSISLPTVQPQWHIVDH